MAAKQGLTAQIHQYSEDTKRSLLSRAPAGIKSHSWLSNLNTTCTIKSAPPRTPTPGHNHNTTAMRPARTAVRRLGAGAAAIACLVLANVLAAARLARPSRSEGGVVPDDGPRREDPLPGAPPSAPRTAVAPVVSAAPNTCRRSELDPSHRTVDVAAPSLPGARGYTMFVHGPGIDSIISDSVVSTRGRASFEENLRAFMDAQLRGRTPEETTILDIGGNIGLWALHYAARGFRVHSFEPVRENFRLMECSKVESGLDNLILNNYALSDRDAELCMKLNPTNQGGHQVDRVGECPPRERVRLRRLDEYYATALGGQSPYMIKIDVEGHEMFAFLGGREMLARDPPKLILSEVVPWLFPKNGQDVRGYYDFFRGYGYEIYRVRRRGQSATMTPARPEDELEKDMYDLLMVHSTASLARGHAAG